MKLATYVQDGATKLGLVEGDQIFDLAGYVPDLPADMVALIASWDRFKAAVASRPASVKGQPLSSVTLKAPVARPGKIMAIGLNYADHIEETGLAKPVHQVWFTKAVTSINDPYATVEKPKASTQLDYEVELVAIIGKGGRHISAADAPKHVFGYCVGNDVSARDWQLQTPQWALGKSFDTHGPIGPWIVTTDEITDPHTLGLRCLINGEVRQSSNTKHLVFNIWDQIAHLSKAMTLEPGDVIFTGTPGGVGVAMKPPHFLEPGDVMRCEIDRIGALDNKVVAEV